MKTPLLLLAVLLALSGCQKPERRSGLGEVTGYVCATCQARFYVEQTVTPEVCPQCKATSLQPLVGYVCAADNHLTLNTRRSKPLPCEHCGAQTSSVRAPTAAELEASGAVKKSKADFPK